MRNLLRTILLSLSAVFFAWTNPLSIGATIAQTNLVPAPSLQEEQPAETMTSNNTNLPAEVQSAVLQDAARRTTQNVSVLRIVEAKAQTWTDGCLGLAKPDEFCTQVMTPGWQVVVTDGQNNWTYRTDNYGNLVKLERGPSEK